MIKAKQNLQKQSLHVKTGDRVIVISGKDKGKIGSIKKSLPRENKITVEGVNIVTKSMKKTQQNEQGGFVKFEAPINSSKVMLYCQKCEKPTRIRHQELESGKKTRVCKHCGEQLDI